MFVVFDLDGTLADIRHRVHFVRGRGKPDWGAFFAACADDTANWPVVQALYAHRAAGHRVEIWSGRSDIVRQETEAWLEREAGIGRHLLTHMRAAGDNTPDVVLKRHWLYRLHPDERPDVVYDDRQRVVDMWREEGVACFQVTANWETNDRIIAPTVSPLLTIMVGPSGAGKSTIASSLGPPVISSDDLRSEYTGDFRDQSRNSDVFEAMHRMARARLDSGLPVVLDATHLRRRDRLAAASLCPPGAGVKYLVVDRSLEDKLRDRGWRSEDLIRKHHERMQSVLRDVMAGDDLPEVHVFPVMPASSSAARAA